MCVCVRESCNAVLMEQCACVERELEKVLHRFVTYGHQSEERLDELLRNVCELRSRLVAYGELRIHLNTKFWALVQYDHLVVWFLYLRQ